MKKLVVLAALALSACAPDFNPAPDYKGGYLWDSDRSRTVTVEAGDTLYSISRRYDVPTKVIADRNGLREPYALTVGQTLILDPTRVHVVQGGDTLQSIAQRYGVEPNAVAVANELPLSAQLRPGTEVWIPDPFTSAAAPTRMASVDRFDSALPPVTAAPRNSQPITSETLPPVPGATVVTPPPAVPRPPIPPAPAVEDAPLSAPVAVQPRYDTPVPTIPVAPNPLAAAPAPIAPSAAIPAAPALPPQQAVPEPPPATVANIAPATASGGARFAWPLSGKIVARFGAAGKGLHNDGINIAAPAGTQVRAADAGVVAYAGNELKGFGNLLLVKHADGWTTAYAHNGKLLVAKGDKVAQGQVIAVVGKTGNVDSPQLHFEVRKGTQAMDPLDYLAKTGG